ncbi:MAG: methyltransferase [Solirubrobacteraceae bacterium]
MSPSKQMKSRAAAPPPFAVDAAFAMRRLLLRAADALLPATAVVWDRSMGLERTQVIGVLAELGVADELAAGTATAADLAPRVGADADALHRVMRAAAVDGLLKIDRRGRFKLTRLGRTLRTDAPSSLRPWARYMTLNSTQAAWGGLLESVRTGQSSFERVHGMSVWDWFAAHPEEEKLFAAAMRAVTDFEAPALAASSMWPDEGTVCDVAGGAGTLLAAVLAARPRLRGILVETPGVLKEAEAYLEHQGVGGRVELVEGDLFGEIRARADVYAMKNILHDWDDPTSAKIVATVRATMAPGSRLVLAEQLQERNVPHPLASPTDLQMLTQCVEGRERSRDELRGLLAGAGLVPGRVERVGASALVEGRATA